MPQKPMTIEMAYRLIFIRGLVPTAEAYETEELKTLCEELQQHTARIHEIHQKIKTIAQGAQE